MARRKIREYDAKRLLSRNLPIKLRCVQIDESTDWKELEKAHPWLSEEKLVVKPDMLFGKRGKNNLVLLNANLHQAQKFVAEFRGQDVDVSGVKGRLTHFILEPFIPHQEEYYLSIVSTRDGSTINFSDAGGMEVEENWDKMLHLDIPTGKPIDKVDIEGSLDNHAPKKRGQEIADFIRGCFIAYRDLDFTLLELNPFTFDIKGNPVPLDMRVELDDTASFKNMRKWDGISFPKPFGRQPYPEEQHIRELDAKTGASLKLTVLNPKGRIWTMVAGGGASVIYTDTVVDMGFGDELGNYGEYSGNPNEEETYQYASTILDLATRHPDGRPRALLVGGGIANFTDVANTFKGIIHALRDHKDRIKQANMRVFVRRGGPNYQSGLKLMRELGDELGVPIEVFGPEASMTNIVPLAIEHIRGG